MTNKPKCMNSVTGSNITSLLAKLQHSFPSV